MGSQKTKFAATLKSMKHPVAVVMGGFSSEHDISIASGNMVYKNLSRSLFTPYRVIISKDAWYVLSDDEQRYPINKDDFSCTVHGERINFDAVFNAIHGTPGEDGPLAAYFDLIGLPQTASSQFTSALTFSKMECSLVMKHYGVNIPEAWYLNRGDDYDPAEIIAKTGLPCFVKPSRSGSSIGVTKVSNREDLDSAIAQAFLIDEQVIVEQMISGVESACGVSNHTGSIAAFAVTDIVPQNEFFDYESKYSGNSEEVTPARIDAGTYQQIMEESEFIYSRLRLNGLARVDYIVSENGVPFFIEVNTIPGLSSESILPKQVAYCGLSIGEVFDRCLMQTINQKQ